MFRRRPYLCVRRRRRVEGERFTNDSAKRFIKWGITDRFNLYCLYIPKRRYSKFITDLGNSPMSSPMVESDS